MATLAWGPDVEPKVASEKLLVLPAQGWCLPLSLRPVVNKKRVGLSKLGFH